jgi:hypothetical protein
MDIPTAEDLARLTERGSLPRVSLYMPTHQAGPDTRQDPIRLKNLLTEAEAGLIAAGVRPTIARDTLAPVWELQADYEFWQHQSTGLAVFVEGDFVRSYRLPLTLPELAVVTPRFHLKPLLPVFTNDLLFYVLAISMNDVRCFECTPFGEQRCEIPEMPESMADALWADDREKSLQFRSFSSTGRGDVAMFHGSSEVDKRHELLRYFQQVDPPLTRYLGNSQAPLVLAAVDYLVPIYREASSYRAIMDQHLGGNPEELRPEELRERAWEIARGRIESGIAADAARYAELKGTGKTSNQVAEAAVAAANGRVDVAFVETGVQEWGRFDQAANTVVLSEEPQPGDQDMLDFVALRTYLNGGGVHVLAADAMPDGPIAVMYRY